MKRIVPLLVFAACWVDRPPQVVIREVPTYRYIHDVPRECKGLPEFPAVSELGDQMHFVSTWVQQLDAWVQAAGACLDTRTYHITDLVEEKRP